MSVQPMEQPLPGSGVLGAHGGAHHIQAMAVSAYAAYALVDDACISVQLEKQPLLGCAVQPAET